MQDRATLLVKGGKLLDIDADPHRPRLADILIEAGIITVQDMLTLSPLSAGQVEVVTGAYREVGLRVILGLQVANVSPLDTTPFWREVIPVELQANLLGPPPTGAADPLAVMEEIFR